MNARSFLAYGLPIHVMALIYVFLGIYYARTNALERTVVWLVYKVLVTLALTLTLTLALTLTLTLTLTLASSALYVDRG